LQVEGTDAIKLVLLISINPGATNGGSSTHYFIGDFDGKTFTSDQEEHKWLDWGRDNYAGVTYNNTPDMERIFIGWMSNWDYARDTPTEKWRSAMTVPRKLSLQRIDGDLQLFNYPLEQMNTIIEKAIPVSKIEIKENQKKVIDLKYGNQSQIKFMVNNPNLKMIFSNMEGDTLLVDINSKDEMLLLDRAKSGLVDFSEKFVEGVQQMPIENLPKELVEVRMLLDHSSLEFFINKGQYVMTNQLFPNQIYSQLTLWNNSGNEVMVTDFSENKVKRIWE